MTMAASQCSSTAELDNTNNSDGGNKRRICFADEPEVLIFEQDGEKNSMWFGHEISNRNKEECYRDGRVYARKGWGTLLDESFSEPPRNVLQQLHTFVLLGDEHNCPRGIERLISTKHGDERRFSKSQQIESVVDTFVYMSNKGESQETIEKAVAELSMEYSKAATEFARNIAIADELALVEDGRSSPSSSVEEDTVSAKPSSAVTAKRSARSKMTFSSKTLNRGRRLSNFITNGGHVFSR